MPQLDPAPWLMMLTLSWVTYITLIPNKVVKHKFPNNPSPQSTEKPQTRPWTWPWS
uniref:ATP synthase complex subunit 8 n=1 Tax=Centropristis striata TaxID=184440 RepID=A0A5J6BSI5_CENSR|nr:ATP synthase F0 subunit 8 [Centropristis striata]QEP94857.1 ATP synthase F0 subunit 8 [Centropristis striata]WMY90504.1 ATP synthase F0 subunit 8 [Centropristis striata]